MSPGTLQSSGDRGQQQQQPVNTQYPCVQVPDDRVAWDAVEIGAAQQPAITVRQLIQQDPDNVIQFIAKKGVVKLGEFKVRVCGAAGVRYQAEEAITEKQQQCNSSEHAGFVCY